MRRFVRKRVPALLETMYGWLPGNLFNDVMESAVRGGEV